MSRSPAPSGQSVAPGKNKPDIKPSDVYELRLKTQQIVSKTRQLRTQLNRLNDRILSRTNAIQRTREQQSETPAVATNHSNSIPQLRRSVIGEENALDDLQNKIFDARQDDRTFLVKELEEEVKLAYCENQRLTKNLQESKAQANSADRLLQEASTRASNQNINALQAQVRELLASNAQLRDKAVAYTSKKQKLDIEKVVKEHADQKIPTDKSIEQAKAKQEATSERAKQQADQLAADKEQFYQKVAELNRIIDEQRRKITECLSGRQGEGYEEQ
jgi:hypothetical protein